MDGDFSAFRWQHEHDSALIEAALTNGALDGRWHADEWGVAFEVLFVSEEQWEAFRSLPAARCASDSSANAQPSWRMASTSSSRKARRQAATAPRARCAR